MIYETKRILQNVFTFFLFVIVCSISLAQLRDISVLSIGIEISIIFFLFLKILKITPRKYAIIYLVLFFIHFILVVYQSTHGDLPMSGNDWSVFDSNAKVILDNANNFFQILSPPSTLANRGDYFERIVAIVYYFLGEQSFYIYYLSFIFSQIVFIYIYKLVFFITNIKKLSYISSIIFYLWPMEIIYSVSYLREMTIQCFFVISLYYFLKGIKQYNKNKIGIGLIISFFVSQMHSGMWGVFFGYIIVLICYVRSKKKIIITPLKIFLVVIFFTILLISPLWGEVAGRLAKAEGINSLTSSGGSVLTSVGTTDYISAPSSSIGVVLQTPIRFILFLISPLPWQVRSLGTVLALLLDGIFRYYIMISIFKVLRNRNKLLEEQRLVLDILIIVWIITTLIFCWGTNNYGTAMRHRLKIFPLEIIIFYTLKKYICMNKSVK